MSARRVWIATCEICESTKEFDGFMTEIELGSALLAAGWELPGYGGTFCVRCARAVKALSINMNPDEARTIDIRDIAQRNNHERY